MFDDGTSVSWGRGNGGRLLNARQLPRRGDGFRIPPTWATRGLNYGTDEMIDLLVYLGRRMHQEYPDAEIAVADISRQRGGGSRWHRSHQTGRDVDILFLAVDELGRPARTDSMRHLLADGATEPIRDRNGKRLRTLYFDVERNWYLVRSVIENPVARVQYVFLYDPLRQMLLDHACAIGEPPDIILQASHILRQPSDSANHDDHFHVRIYCERSDRHLGCRDRGLLRWTKKDRKYALRPRRGRAPPELREALTGPMPAMLSLTSLPFRAARR
jgi:penicillin-insensitive murein endopeptidase